MILKQEEEEENRVKKQKNLDHTQETEFATTKLINTLNTGILKMY